MTTNDKENVERKLNHVLDMGKRIIDLYRHITCTERAALLLAMTAAVRQTVANMQTVAGLLRKNLLDPFRINYTEYAREIEQLLKIWGEELKGAPIFHNLDKHERPITNPYDIALKEDTDYDLTMSEQGDFDFFQTRVDLMGNAALMCEIIEKGLEQIGKTLREIVEDYSRLKADSEKQDKCLKELERSYEEWMWKEDFDRLVTEVEIFVANRDNRRDKETFELLHRRMEWEATDPHDIKVLAELNEWYLCGQRPAAFIVENRDKLTIESIARHFRFVRCRRLLKQKIESFELLQPAQEKYKDLFVNRAAEELAFLLAYTIGKYVDFKHNYQYAALQMAMQDLGMVYNDRNNGVQMRDFIEEAYLAGEKIRDQKTLTDWTGKLLGSMFGVMDEDNLKGNYTPKDFEKMKNYYWLCLSIINKVVQIDLEEMQFADYLHEEHENTPTINDYKNRDGESIMERLSILKSVIKGETLL